MIFTELKTCDWKRACLVFSSERSERKPNANNLLAATPWQVVGQAIEEGSVPFEITITTDEEGKTLTVQDTVSETNST